MLNAVGAHIYAGGFTLGVSAHFNVLAHLEHDGYGSEVAQLNFPALKVYAGGPSKWPDRWHGLVPFMFANPPCAIWSGANFKHRENWRLDPRLAVHRDIFNYAMDVVAPDVLVIESVPPSFTKGREHIEDQIRRAETYGYATTVVMHDTQWLGVPQKRRRIFYTYHKVAIPWAFPAFAEPTTVRQAFKGLPKKSKGYPLPALSVTLDKYVRLTPPGGSLEKAFAALNPDAPVDARGWRTGAPSMLARRLPWDSPAPVALYPFHPSEPRRLTMEEVTAVCSFPQDWLWPTYASCDKVAGWANRGIMPKAAEWLAGLVREGLEANIRLNDLSPSVFDVVKPPGAYYNLQASTSDKGEFMPRAPAPAHPPAGEDEGSGAYIRRLLQAEVDDETILEAVHAQYEGSRAKKSDISWNRGQLKKMVENGGVMPSRKKAAAPPPPPPAPAKRGRGRPPKQQQAEAA